MLESGKLRRYQSQNWRRKVPDVARLLAEWLQNIS
jgi:hypothetical protein